MELASFGVMALALVFVCVGDFRERLIPNGALLVLLAERLLLLVEAFTAPDSLALPGAWGLPALAESIGVAILVVVLIAACAWLVGRLSGRPALGMGDLKLYVVLVLFLDPDATFALLAVSAAAGLVLALIYRFVLREDSFPFAPAIVIGFVFALVNGGFMVVPLG